MPRNRPNNYSDDYGIDVHISFGMALEEPSVYFLEVYERLCKNRPFNYGYGYTGNRRYTFYVYTDDFVEPSLYLLYVFRRICRNRPYMYRDGFVRYVPICIGTVVAVSYIRVTAVVALPDTGYSRIHSSSAPYIRIHQEIHRTPDTPE